MMFIKKILSYLPHLQYYLNLEIKIKITINKFTGVINGKLIKNLSVYDFSI